MTKLINNTGCPSNATEDVNVLEGEYLSACGGVGHEWELLKRINKNREMNDNV